MLKKVYGKKFNRSGRSRTAMFRGLVRGLAENGHIRTTEAKAKALQQEMDKLFQLMRKNTLASRRDMLSRLGNDSATVDTLYSRYMALANSRKSGFTSLKWEDARRGDNTRMAQVELIQVKENEQNNTKES
jgi:large subunit ribosomal protein L17